MTPRKPPYIRPRRAAGYTRLIGAFLLLPPPAYFLYLLSATSAECRFSPAKSAWEWILALDFCFEPLFALVAFHPAFIVPLLAMAYAGVALGWLPLFALMAQRRWLASWQVSVAAGALSCVFLTMSRDEFHAGVYLAAFLSGAFSGMLFWLMAVRGNPALSDRGSLIETVATHSTTSSTLAPMPAEIRYTNPPALPAPPGYSQVTEIVSGRPVYIAGQVAVDSEGHLVGGSDFEAQADQVFRNLTTALASAGCTPRDLVKLTVFIRDMGNLALYRKARDRFLNSTSPPAAPAITLVEVSRLYGEEFLLEIEAVAAAG